MSPSAGKSPPSSTRSCDIKDISVDCSPEAVEKENQRPPIFNPEDYLLSLKKYGKRGSTTNCQSVYDKTEDSSENNEKQKLEMSRSKTLPAKKSASKTNSVSSTATDSSEMSLRQFGSITDLLTKLRADLRCAFLSFVQEFVASPVDGVSLLLEVLRALQLSQSASFDKNASLASGFRSHAFQRRALLDELACLQCLSICCARAPDAGTRLGTTPIGLLPLAVSATGTGIRSRILAIQLLTVACDKVTLSDASHRTTSNGHSAVSDALSTLRLRCGEPVRFRLMAGMFNSGGGTGELQTVGLKFFNTFIESAETVQDRLYIQAELHQAGFEPKLLLKTVSSDTPWFEKLTNEVKKWEIQKIDVEALQAIALNAEQLRSKLVTLERRVTTLQDEKSILSTMERRLQERCAELQKEVRRLREAQKDMCLASKSPVALPRQGLPKDSDKQMNSEHEDEGISGSDTGQSISPEPISGRFTRKSSSMSSNKFSILLTEDESQNKTDKSGDEEHQTTIEDVIEELENIVSDAEKDIYNQADTSITELQLTDYNQFSSFDQYSSEYEIIPSNLLPAPPKKTKSLLQLLCNPSDVDSSEYMVVDPPQTKNPFYTEEYDRDRARKIYIESTYTDETYPQPDLVHNVRNNRNTRDNTNRALLNVIMDAREKERRSNLRAHSLERDVTPPQQFNGVFFMSDMSGRNARFPCNNVTPAFESRRVSKSLDKVVNCGVDSMIDVVEPISERPRYPPPAPTKPRTSSGNKPPMVPYSSNLTKYKTGLLQYGLPISTRGTSRASSNIGSKVTDVVSGLY